MTPNLSKASRAKLAGVHPDLVAVVERASALMRGKVVDGKRLDFRVTHGLRTVTEQKVLFRTGKSQTMNSRHLTGHAIDIVALVDGAVSWDFKPWYREIAATFKQAAMELGIEIIWGGDWRSLIDGPHFELDRRKYP